MACVMMLAITVNAAPISGNDVALRFNPNAGSEQTLTFTDGKTVKYMAYEHIYFVKNVEDTAYQYLNLYVPSSLVQSDNTTPVFLRTYIGGYMAAKAAGPKADDASGRALREGYVLCIPGSRGRRSTIQKKGKTIYTGRAPAAILDLKAAIRWLKYNDDLIPGSSDKIITDGTSAGGAMSSLMGATGNAAVYEPYLKKMGAADATDHVFASVCYCPITDLDHADMAYEWMYGCTNRLNRHLNDYQIGISNELAAQFPAYINSLNLKKDDGTAITASNYLDYVKSILMKSFQRAKNEGCNIPDTIGIKFNEIKFPDMGGMPNGRPGRPIGAFNGNMPDRGHGGPQGDNKGNFRGMRPDRPFAHGEMGFGMEKPQGEFVVDVDMTKYLNYVVSTRALKNPPAFDHLGVYTSILDSIARIAPVVAEAAQSLNEGTGENEEFGDNKGSQANFTTFGLRKSTKNGNAELGAEMKQLVYMLNPMYFIGDSKCTTAKHWYIRHGARDRDTAFPIAINLATKLMNNGCDVDFRLPWNRPHSGDYNLDDLFEWIRNITK